MEIINYLRFSDKPINVIEDCGKVNSLYAGKYITLPVENYDVVRDYIISIDKKNENYCNKVFSGNNFQFIKSLVLSIRVVEDINTFTELFESKYGNLSDFEFLEDISSNEPIKEEPKIFNNMRNNLIKEEKKEELLSYGEPDFDLTDSEEVESLKEELEELKSKLLYKEEELMLVKSEAESNNIESESKIKELECELENIREDKYSSEATKELLKEKQSELIKCQINLEKAEKALEEQKTYSLKLLEELKKPNISLESEYESLMKKETVTEFYEIACKIDSEVLKEIVKYSIEELVRNGELEKLAILIEILLNKIVERGGF